MAGEMEKASKIVICVSGVGNVMVLNLKNVFILCVDAKNKRM